MKRQLILISIVLSLVIISVFIVSYAWKIETDYYCCESPTVRWKFAIYCGEYDDETGSHFTKLEESGMLEYFGLKNIDCKTNK